MKGKWKKPKWAIQQIFRDNGVIEDICEHEIGHPNKEWLDKYPSPHNSLHFCDGCCTLTTCVKKDTV